MGHSGIVKAVDIVATNGGSQPEALARRDSGQNAESLMFS